MGRIRILIADDIVETRNLIIKLLSMREDDYEVVAQAGNGQEAVDMIAKYDPDIVLMDINMPVLNGLEAAEIIEERYPNVLVIIMSVQSDSEYLKKAMFHGAKDYIIKPFTFDQIVESIDGTYNKYHGRVPTRPKEADHHAKLSAFFGTKGGVGKSVLASNYGLLISKETSKKILIWDMDLQFGDMALLFDKQRGKNISNLVDEAAYKNHEAASEFIEKIGENLHLLCAPTSPEKAEYISKDIIMQLLDILRHQYDHIIFDLGVNYDESTLAILDVCDKIYFITTPELLALKNAKQGLNVMKSLDYETSKVSLIVNRFSNAYLVKQNQIEELLQYKVELIIMDEPKEYINAVNTGEPILSGPKYKGTGLYKNLSKLEM